MAKRSLFWGQASGKLGETVLYRAGGEQRTRTYVAKIKNPKTLAQVENRLSMLNFASVYRALKPILSISFPNRPTAQSGFNAFVKANKGVNSAVIAKEDAQRGLCAPVDMLVSEGYLTQFGLVKAQLSGQDMAILLDVTNVVTDKSAFNGAPVGFTAFEHAMFNADALDIPASAKFTVVVATYADTGYTIKYETKPFSELKNISTMAGVTVGVAKTTEGNILLGFNTDDAEAAEILGTVIISWTDANGKLQISTSRMVGSDASKEYANQFIKGGDFWNDVLNHYGYNEGSVLG